MKAVRYHGPGQPFRLEEVDKREPGAGEVLVRVAASGVCYTELHFKSGLLDLGVAPVTMGHEVVGRIESAGEGVSPDRLDERVIVYYYLGCLECAYCRVGDEQLCPNLRAEYVTVPARNAVPLPATISDVEAAPIGCGVTTAVHAAKLAEPRVGEWIAVDATFEVYWPAVNEQMRQSLNEIDPILQPFRGACNPDLAHIEVRSYRVATMPSPRQLTNRVHR